MRITKSYTIDLDLLNKWEKVIEPGLRSRKIAEYMKRELKK